MRVVLAAARGPLCVYNAVMSKARLVPRVREKLPFQERPALGEIPEASTRPSAHSQKPDSAGCTRHLSSPVSIFLVSKLKIVMASVFL